MAVNDQERFGLLVINSKLRSEPEEHSMLMASDLQDGQRHQRENNKRQYLFWVDKKRLNRFHSHRHAAAVHTVSDSVSRLPM